MAFRTKKISQMDPKGSNLASTDLLEISQLVSGSYVTKSITGAEIIASIPPSATAWGTITGTLSSQTDLNTALSGKVPTTRTLTINGTTQDLSADRTFTVSTGITIGTTAITSGTVGRVLFEGTGNVVQESANLFWDNTNARLGVGTSSPSAIVHSVGSVTASGAIARANYLNNTLVASANSDVLVGLDITPTFTNGAFTGVTNIGQRINIPSTKTAQTITDGTGNVSLVYNRDATNSWVTMTTTGSAGLLYEFRHATRPGFNFLTPGAIGTGIGQDTTGFIISNTSNVYPGVPYFKLFNNTGNVVLQNGGTLVDAGFRLDVNGTARFNGNLTFQNTNPVLITSTPLIIVQSTYGFYVGTSGGSATIASFTNNAYGQNTSIVYPCTFGAMNTLADGSSLIDMRSTTRGFLPPRMTTTQKNAIATPATGLMVYDTTLNLISVYNGTIWISL